MLSQVQDLQRCLFHNAGMSMQKTGIGDTPMRKWRVIKYADLSTSERRYTLVQEWESSENPGKLLDNRWVMNKEEFQQLKEAVNEDVS